MVLVKVSLIWVLCNKKNEINERKRHKSTYKAGKKKDIKLKKKKTKKVLEKSRKSSC